MLFTPGEVAARTGKSASEIQYELNNRFTQALMCLMAALVGFATLLLGNYSRFGIWWQILTAFTLLVGLKLIEGAVAGPVLANIRLWGLMYMPSIGGAVLTVILLQIGSRPGMFGRMFTRRRKVET